MAYVKERPARFPGEPARHVPDGLPVDAGSEVARPCRNAGKSTRIAPRHSGRKHLIVELYGPTAAGKTTFARALAAALAEQGIEANLVMSLRPAERLDSPAARGLSKLRRLSPPAARAAKLLRAVSSSLPTAPADPIAEELLKALPPRHWYTSIRLRPFLMGLVSSWNAPRAAGSVVIFDQAFMSAIITLNHFARRSKRSAVARALDIVPVPDLLVRLDAPTDVLAERLRDRLGRQSALERAFEIDIATSLKQLEILEDIDLLLRERNRASLRVRCLDQDSSAAALRTIATAVETRLAGIAA